MIPSHKRYTSLQLHRYRTALDPLLVNAPMQKKTGNDECRRRRPPLALHFSCPTRSLTAALRAGIRWQPSRPPPKISCQVAGGTAPLPPPLVSDPAPFPNQTSGTCLSLLGGSITLGRRRHNTAWRGPEIPPATFWTIESSVQLSTITPHGSADPDSIHDVRGHRRLHASCTAVLAACNNIVPL